MDTLDFASLVALILLYTVVFDTMDLQPQIGSFRFLWSFTYAFYLLFRSILGVLASLAMAAAVPDLSAPVWALLGVLGSVTILQNFALNVGGTDIANLAALRDRYKARMSTEAQERASLRRNTRILTLQERLERVPLQDLERAYRRMLLTAYTPDVANAQIAELRQGAGDDEANYIVSLAYNIAAINPDYAEQLVATQARPTPPSAAGP